MQANIRSRGPIKTENEIQFELIQMQIIRPKVQQMNDVIQI